MPVSDSANWITADSRGAVEAVLRERGLIGEKECLVELGSAGEGNMNVTLRAITEQRSLIVKQSRPFVARYESIPAPEERIHVEAAFYQFASQHPQVSRAMPKLLDWIPERNLLVLEDLGQASDATSIYRDSDEATLPSLLSDLSAWLCALHESSRELPDRRNFRNRSLRELNHAHIFLIPFQERPATDLDSVCAGFCEASRHIRTDPQLQETCRQLGDVYLTDGEYLLHGDFYPGSWLLTSRGPFVIDPEFCFPGCREFDVGVMTGHIALATGIFQLDRLQDDFASASGMQWSLAGQFAAIEVLRRLLGVAQLPLSLNLEQRVQLINDAASALRD